MISKQEVRHIAKLARLDISKKEIEKFQKEFSAILDYFETLKEVDVSKVRASSWSIETENVMRNDEIKTSKPEERKKIIDQMPETKQGYLKVKSVF